MSNVVATIASSEAFFNVFITSKIYSMGRTSSICCHINSPHGHPHALISSYTAKGVHHSFVLGSRIRSEYLHSGLKYIKAGDFYGYHKIFQFAFVKLFEQHIITTRCRLTFTLSIGYMTQCSRMPEAAPATMWAVTLLVGSASYPHSVVSDAISYLRILENNRILSFKLRLGHSKQIWRPRNIIKFLEKSSTALPTI